MKAVIGGTHKPMRASDTIFESFIYIYMNLYKNVLILKYVYIICSFFVSIVTYMLALSFVQPLCLLGGSYLYLMRIDIYFG